MIVDDDPDLLELLTELVREEGYDVIGAANGAAALALLRSSGARPSVILLDLMMPVLDGWGFRREQLQDPELRDIPVIVLTADVNARAKAAKAGTTFSEFLLKPVSFEVLLQRVRDRVAPAQ